MSKTYAPESVATSAIATALAPDATRDKGAFTLSAARVSPAPELKLAVVDTVKELACSKYLMPSDAERMKGHLAEALQRTTRADGTPLYDTQAKVAAATESLYGKLVKDTTQYNKDMAPSALDGLMGNKKEMEAAKAATCAAPLAAQEVARYGR